MVSNLFMLRRNNLNVYLRLIILTTIKDDSSKIDKYIFYSIMNILYCTYIIYLLLIVNKDGRYALKIIYFHLSEYFTTLYFSK